MRSAKPSAYRAGLLAVFVVALAVFAAGCHTTQDTAAEKQAESKRILEARKQKHKQAHDHGSKKR